VVNDRQDPYGHVYGYDEYGRPLYGTMPQQPPATQEYDYGTGQQPQPQPRPAPDAYDYGGGQPAPVYDGYAPYDYGTGQQAPVTDTYGGPAGAPGHGYGQDPGHAPAQAPGQDYGYDYGTGEQPPVADAYDYGTGEQPPVADAYDYGTGEQPPVPPVPRAATRAPEAGAEPPGPAARQAPVPRQRRPPADDYHTEQFSFVEEQDEETEDVIDWLKFTESRTERREEAKRRGRSRRRLLIVAVVLAVLGSVGALWATGRLPFVPGPDTAEEAAPGAETRDVIVVHLRQTDSDETATALLIANETAGTGTTLLLPNELAVTPDGGTTTLGQAVTDEAAGSVRDAIGGLLGADIKGTWRLDTPYLEVLVDLVGGITLDTDAEVPGEDEASPLVPRGEGVQLGGPAAIAYAVHRGDEEPQSAQLARFGQVMQAVLVKLPSSEDGATRVIEALAQITDPSLTEEDLGISLARLAGYAQSGGYTTTPLPVESDGTLSDATADGLVVDVLGGTVSNADPSAAPRIAIRDASGADLAEQTHIDLINGGFTVVDSRAADETAAESRVTYSDEAHRETALEVALTLGLPETAVTQGDGAGNADVTIILGEDDGQ
jgi:anionic cell wall polymer biosynthesis LytR-Cps2A-Psr (LCP) family protein